MPLPQLLLQHAEVCAALMERHVAHNALIIAASARSAAEQDEHLARMRMDAANVRQHSAFRNYVEMMGALFLDQPQCGSKLVICLKGKGKGCKPDGGEGKGRGAEEGEPEGKWKGRAVPVDDEEDDITADDEDDDDEDADKYSSE